MRKKIFAILAGVMMIALTVAGAVYAEEYLEVEGRVTEVGPNYLIVDGVRYEIALDSEFDEDIESGDWVKIKYYEETFESAGDLLIIVEAEIEDEPETEYEEFEVEGTVETITEDPRTLTLEEYEFEFLITDDSEFEDEIEPGDYVKIKYYEDEEGQLILIEVELEEVDDDEDDMDGDKAESPVCTGDMVHPALMKLAESYDVEYEELLPYFCEQNFGVGEIMLALKTAGREDVDGTFEDILMRRSSDGMKDVGWGEIWQELGLIGNGRQDNEEVEPEAMNEKGNQDKGNPPVTPPGQSGDHPGRGKGRGN